MLPRLLRALVLLLRDALSPGWALPLDPRRVARPGFLERLLRDHAVPAHALQGRLAGVTLTGQRSVSSNCENQVLALDWEEADGTTQLPDTVYLKMPVRSLATRAFFALITSWELECRFYRNVAPQLPVPTPRAYAVQQRGSRFLMLLENLYAVPGVTLHINADVIQGPSLDTVRRCLATMARFHAHFHGIDRDERERLLPTRLQPYTSPVMRAVSPWMGRRALRNCLDGGALDIAPRHVESYTRALDNWNRLVDHWTSGPLTLVHGDSHLGNHYLCGEDAGMLDWQAVQWGKGVRDVQYFLTDSLPAELLARHEGELFYFYLEQVSAHGVALDPAESWHQYRGFSFQTWMTIVVSMGLGAMTEAMDEVMPEIHRRCIASIERLQLAEWLDEVLP